MKSLGIDIGVSFIKIGILSDDEVTNVKRVASPTSCPQTGMTHEVDPVCVFHIIKDLIDLYLQEEPSIEGIYFSTQMHGFVLVNQAFENVQPYISWKDRRSEAYIINDKVSALSWLQKETPFDCLAKTGMKLRSGLPSVNLFVLQKQNKLDSKLSFGTLGDYVVSRLTKTKISTSLSNAAGSGLFDIINKTWNESLIDFLGIELSFPEVKQDANCQCVGYYKGVKVFAPIGDQQAALLGLDMELSNLAVSNIATGSQATVVSDQLVLNSQFQTRPFVDGCYLLTIPFIPAGRSLNALVRFLQQIGVEFFNSNNGYENVWDMFIEYASTIKPEEYLKNTIRVNSDLIGTFEQTGGSINFINENNLNIKQIVCAFISDIVANHVRSLKILNEFKDFDTVILSGGVSSKLNIIKYLFELNLSKNISESGVTEDALNGLRVMALKKVERW